MARWTSGLVMSYGLLAVVLLCVCDVVRGHPILAKSAVTVNEPEHAQRPHRCAHSSLTPQYTIGKQEYADIDSSGRRSRRDGMEPIRIHFHLDAIQDKPEDQRDYITDLLDRSREWLATALMVSPVEGKLAFQRQCKTTQDPCPEFFDDTPGCGGEFTTVPEAHLRPEPSANLPGGGGVSDTDIVIYVTEEETELCQGGTLAYALSCQRDQIDRPTFGHVNFCPNEVKPTANVQERTHDLSTAIHEIFHILGFSSNAFPFYREPDGTPRTPRCPGAEGCGSQFNPGAPPLSNGEYLVSSNTVAVSTNSYGSVRKLVTPEVVRVAQQHFACDTLDGIELENEGGSGTAGSHWEKRQMINEFMVGILSSSWSAIKSPVSLAALQDSGWYQVDYTAADKLLFGLEEGCDYADDVCASNTEYWCQPDPDDSTQRTRICTFDRQGIGLCDAADPLTDGCAFSVAFGNGRCDNSSGRVVVDNCGDEPCKGVAFGESTACFESTLVRELYTYADSGVGCYAFRCIEDGDVANGVLEIRTPDGSWHSCNDETELGSDGFDGAISCPTDWRMLCNSATEPITPPTPPVNPPPNCDQELDSGDCGDPPAMKEEVLFTAVLAMSEADFTTTKRREYRTAVAEAGGSNVQLGDVEIVSVIEASASRRRLLTTSSTTPEATTTAASGGATTSADARQAATTEAATTEAAATTTPAPATPALDVETKVMVPAGTAEDARASFSQSALEQRLSAAGIALSSLGAVSTNVPDGGGSGGGDSGAGSGTGSGSGSGSGTEIENPDGTSGAGAVHRMLGWSWLVGAGAALVVLASVQR